MSEPSTGRFVALDAWRGIAAVLVALYRIEAGGYLHFLGFVQNAWLFVDFFFVLSGFVIAGAYGDRLGSGPTTLAFVLRRFGRLWPLHAAMLAAFVAIECVKYAAGLSQGGTGTTFTEGRAPLTIVWDLLLVQSLGVAEFTAWNSPAWSISTEFWTYLVFALLCFGGRKTVLGIAPLLVAAGLAVVALRSPTAMDTTFEYGFARCLAGFFAGVITFAVWRWLRATFVPDVATATALECATVAVAVVFVAVSGRTAWALLAPVVFSTLVLAFAYEKGRVSRLLTTKVGLLLGELSYSIYMTALLVSLVFNKAPVLIAGKFGIAPLEPHQGALHPHSNVDLGAPWLNDGYSILYLAAVVAVSWVTFRSIEQPTRAWFNRLAARLA